MNVDIYATTRQDTYLVIPSGSPVPPGWTARHWKTMALDQDCPRIGLDPKIAITDIRMQGWSAIKVRIEVT